MKGFMAVGVGGVFMTVGMGCKLSKSAQVAEEMEILWTNGDANDRIAGARLRGLFCGLAVEVGRWWSGQ